MDAVLEPLADQVIVITGASSGIGLATARLAADRRARVVMAARSVRALEELAVRIQDAGGVAMAVPTDVADPSGLRRLAERAVARFGRIDTWINNAGISIYGRLEDVDEADSRHLFDVNFWGTVNGSMAALPWLRRQGGALINVGSEVPEDTAMPLQGMYVASKQAVKGFTDALRLEIEHSGDPVSVTLIQPTALDTPYRQHARSLLGRIAPLPAPPIDPRRVAQAILDAAAGPRRDVKVVQRSHVDLIACDMLPALAEWLAQPVRKG